MRVPLGAFAMLAALVSTQASARPVKMLLRSRQGISPKLYHQHLKLSSPAP